MRKVPDVFLLMDYSMVMSGGDIRFYHGKNEQFFPVDIESKYPEILKLVLALSKITGLDVYLGIEDLENLSQFSEEIVVTSVVVEDIEYLQYVYTPLGTFVLLFFVTDSKAKIVKEVEEVELSNKIRSSLYLESCNLRVRGEKCCVRHNNGAGLSTEQMIDNIIMDVIDGVQGANPLVFNSEDDIASYIKDVVDGELFDDLEMLDGLEFDISPEYRDYTLGRDFRK